MLRLKEQPIEWIKFTAVIGIAVNAILWMIWWQGLLHDAIPVTTSALAILAVVIASLRPYWFRGFYRGGMMVSFQIGQVIGKVLLTLFFFLLVTPMGLLLRLFGKDLLNLKAPKNESSCWHTAKSSREFDRMF
jgi:hypothetical protein